MKNIYKIFCSDVKRIGTNVVAVVIILGLTVIPSLYAWFNILSNWDPYGPDATGNLNVAVYSQDEGMELEGLSLNVGETVMEGLKSNDTIGWNFVDSVEEATAGVYSGEYYAAIVIPEDFSTNMVSFINGDVEHPQIDYYENEKKNAIAPKITQKAKTAVQEQVNSSFVSTLAETMLKISDTVSGTDNSGANILEIVNNKLTELDSSLSTYITVVNSFVNITDSAESLLETTKLLIPSLNDMVDNGQSTVSSMQSTLTAGSSSADAMIDLATYSFSMVDDTLSDVYEVVNTDLTNLINTDGTIQSGVSGTQATLPYIQKLLSQTATAIGDENLTTQINGVNAQIDTLSSSLGTLTSQTSVDTAQVKKLQKKILKEIKNCQGLMADLEKLFNNSVKKSLTSSTTLMQNSLIAAATILSGIDGNFDDVTNILDEYANTLSQGNTSLLNSREMAQEMQTKLQTLMAEIDELNESEKYQQLLTILETDPDMLGEFISSPVHIDTVALYEIETYGSAMSPFYSILAIWVGALILVAIIHVHVHEEPGITNVKPYQKYFGRYIIFFLVGQAQTLLIALGDLLYVDIQCKSPVLFWLAAAVSSFVFTLFIYSLTVAFGNIGEALAIVVMVIQVAGAGGTFPIEMLPKVYQMIYKFLPFPYGMNAMRETIGGMYGMDYWKYLGVLLLFAVFSLFIGLVVAIPFKKLNKMIEESKEKSEIMI